jgi:hypothetical protein
MSTKFLCHRLKRSAEFLAKWGEHIFFEIGVMSLGDCDRAPYRLRWSSFQFELKLCADCDQALSDGGVIPCRFWQSRFSDCDGTSCRLG